MPAYVMTYVRIVNEQGTFVRTSPAKEIPLPLKMRNFSYPDRNAVVMRIYRAVTTNPNDLSVQWSYLEYKLKPMGHDNVAYVHFGDAFELKASDFDGAATETLGTLNTGGFGLNRDPNRILVSETYRPRSMRGRNAHFVGDSSDDAVLSFRANVLPVSQGQFGEYPMYVFCSNSVWAMLVGANGIAFSRIVPFKTHEGLAGLYGLVNVDSAIIYATRSGIKSIPEGASGLSRIIENVTGKESILDDLGPSVALGFLNDLQLGRRELWVSTPSRTYVYHFDHAVWSTIDVTRRSFVQNSRSLLGIGHDGKLYEEADPLAHRSGRFQTAPIHFGEYDLLKRFRRLALKSDSSTFVMAVSKTLYEFVAALSDVEEGLHQFEYEVEIRQEHRSRVRRSDVDAGYYGGYGGSYELYKI